MILVCLDGEEEGRVALSAAEALSDGGRRRVVVVRVSGSKRPAQAGPAEWTLRTDSPVEPLLGFVRRNRVRHVVFGPRAGARWGADFSVRKRRGAPSVLRP